MRAGGVHFLCSSGVWKSADTLLSGVTFREVLYTSALEAKTFPARLPFAVCLGEFLERVVFLGRDPYERLTNMSQQARANEVQFLEHLILRAEAIYNFQPPLPPPPRPWWKLWSKEERELELPSIVADLRNAA